MPTFSLQMRRMIEAQKNVKLIARLALEADDGVKFERPKSAADAADTRSLRGLPAVARGVAGAIRFTNPEGEVVRRDEQQRRRHHKGE